MLDLKVRLKNGKLIEMEIQAFDTGSMGERTRMIAEDRLKFERDMLTRQRMLEKQGWERGLAQGMQEGMAKGAARSLQEGIINLLAFGMSPEQVSLALKAPLEQVLAVQANHPDTEQKPQPS